ncbi:hypothetical protein [Limnohabitans sp. 2KL-1]|uniref:hypothetical protein n=1 Tax=Limnohabitans sp. 2KL-1 TaxID=1100699 RepID=UPI0011B24941|nr:hypothetical protein [Limnohabitans sp. 2KL-1]
MDRRHTHALRSHAKEREQELDVPYAISALKGLNADYTLLKYDANVIEKFQGITGVALKNYRRDHRIYLNYTHQFFRQTTASEPRPLPTEGGVISLKAAMSVSAVNPSMYALHSGVNAPQHQRN